MRISCITRRLLAAGALLLAFASLTSCDNAIYDDEGDCSVTYRVRFRYDRNMKYADAFKAEVNAVSLYIFDKQGSLVWSGTESGPAIGAEDYAMTVDVAPGTYDMVAWCHGIKERASGFTLRGGDTPASKSDLECSLVRKTDSGNAYTDTDLHGLYHGAKQGVVLADSYGTHEVTVDLTKNTNVVRVVLQHIDGSPLDKDLFDFSITSANGLMDHNNRLMADETVTYKSWAKTSGTAQMPDSEGRAITSVSALLAEMTTARLTTGTPATLTVTRRGAGRPIIQIPLTDFVLMIKGEYNRIMDDQEYLDRQDEYNLTFFLDENNDWHMTSGIIINSWRIVLQDTGM